MPCSDLIAIGRYDMSDMIQLAYDAINNEYGLNEKQE
jgi:hypothetical protein